MDQQPQYVFKSKAMKILLPKVLTLIILAALFYVGILVNIGLLKLDGETETIVKSSGLLIMALLVIVGALLNVKKAKTPYKYFPQQITHGKSKISYADIPSVEKKQSIMDKIFGTYTLKLSKKFSIEGIPKDVDLKSYTDQMVSYNKSQIQ